MDKTIGQSLENKSLEENLCILGVPQTRAEAEPEGYNLSCSFPLKNFSCLNLRRKRCSETSRFTVGPSLSCLNLEVPEIISSIPI